MEVLPELLKLGQRLQAVVFTAFHPSIHLNAALNEFD